MIENTPSPEPLPLPEEHGPPVVQRYDFALALGNAAVAVPEFVAAVVRKAGAAALDSLHNLFDAPGYVKQVRLIGMASPEDHEVFNTDSRFSMWGNLKRWLAQTKHKDEAALEKSSFAWISLPAIGAGALAGAGFVNEMTGATEDNSVNFADVAHLGAAGAALALAGGLMYSGSRMKNKIGEIDNPRPNLVRHVDNFYSHAKLDAASSGAATAEAVAHMAGKGTAAINLAVTAIAGYQVWKFWPSRAGKKAVHSDHTDHAHDSVDHGHGHGHCEHPHLIPHEAIGAAASLIQKAKMIGTSALAKTIAKPRRWVRALLTSGLAVAMAGGLLAGSDAQEDERHYGDSLAPPSVAEPQHPPSPQLPQTPVLKPVTECVAVGPHDSQWEIIKRRVSESTGHHGGVAAINAITILTAHQNREHNPDPNAINPGQCLEVPTPAITKKLYEAATDPVQAATQLAKDLAELNRQSSWQGALTLTDTLERIKLAATA